MIDKTLLNKFEILITCLSNTHNYLKNIIPNVLLSNLIMINYEFFFI